MIGISPDVAWDMSIKEVTLAIKGFKEYNTGKRDEPMSKSALEKLRERYPDF